MNVVSELMHQNHAINRAVGEQRWDLRVLIDVVRRRGRIILASLLVCLGLAVAYLMVTPDSFTSTAVLMTDTKQTPPSPSQVTSEALIDPAVIESQIEMLKSQRIALDVADRLHLDSDPEFVGSGPNWKARLTADLFGKPIKTASGEDRRNAAADGLMHKLKVTRTGHSYLAEIAVTTLEPQKSAAIANAVADAYIQDQLDGRMRANQRAGAWMKQRVDEVKGQADAAAASADAFRRQYASELEASNTNKAGLDHSPAARDKDQLARALYQGQVDQLAALAPSGSVRPLTPAKLDELSAINDPTLKQLVDALRRIGSQPAAGQPATGQPARPDLEAAIARRVSQLLAESQAKLKSAQDTAVVVPKQSDDAQAAPMAGEQINRRLKELNAAADAARNDYEGLQNRYVRVTQFMQQQSLPVTEARLITPAQPPLAKSAPKSTVVLLLAGIGGLIVGAGLLLLRESLDRLIRRPDQIKRVLGLPVAGSLPFARTARAVVQPIARTAVSRLRAKLLGQPRRGLVTLFDSRRPWCAATQTLRIVKLAIDQSGRRSNGVSVGIVSPWAGEGKSTLTHNLAQMLSETGARVLVIDADFNKPDLSATFAPSADRGITGLVDGVSTLDQCTTKTDFGFDLLGWSGGTVPLHPFDVLGSQHMQRALAAAQHGYNYTLIDLPALSTSVDARAIASFVDAFVLVAEYGRTTIDDLEQGLSTSEFIANRIVASVLNKSRIGEPSRRHRRAIRTMAA